MKQWEEDRGPILVIMAAGMGSRYGGPKQMDGMGPCGETILHYSIRDALRAGFRRVIFLIKHAIEQPFREVVGRRVEREIAVRYAFQETEMVPAEFGSFPERKKPWGTGHAVLCCAELIDAPFAVINADDFYGAEGFREAYDFLSTCDASASGYMMTAYELGKTTSPSGHVARGVCEVAADGRLVGITERTHIVESSDGPLFRDGEVYRLLPPDTPVSMNLWGFTPTILTELRTEFGRFLRGLDEETAGKAEFFLPTVVDGMLKKGTATVQVRRSADRWWGVTYPEDRASVQAALRRMTEEGRYESPLFGSAE